MARGEIQRVAGTQLDPTVAGAFLTIPMSRLEEISQSYERAGGSLENPEPLGGTLPCPRAAAVLGA